MKFEEEEIGKSFNSTCEEDVYLRWISSKNEYKEMDNFEKDNFLFFLSYRYRLPFLDDSQYR